MNGTYGRNIDRLVVYFCELAWIDRQNENVDPHTQMIFQIEKSLYSIGAININSIKMLSNIIEV